MYNTTPDDLTRIANDLGQIARKYMAGSQELEQHMASLDNTASHLLYGGAKPWVGLASEAFQGAWAERRSRMQQASQLLSEAAQHLNQFAQTIDEYLPQIRMDQQLMQGPTSHMLAPDDQASILNGESQAQNAILMAMQALNSQLEELAYEVRDCPEEQEDGYLPGMGYDPYDNISRNDSNTGSGEQEGDNGNQGDGEDTEPLRVTPEGRLLTKHTDDSFPRHRMTPQQVDDVIDNYSRKTTQRDGATVYIKKQAGRGQKYSIVIEGDDGIVTAMRDLSPGDLARLGRNYGFDPTP